MADTLTLAQLVTALKEKGGYENSRDMTTSVLTKFLNEAIRETFDLLVAKWEDYYVKSATFNSVAGTELYALSTITGVADDFYKLRKVEVSIDGARWAKVYPHDLDAAHRFTRLVGRNYRYRIQAASLALAPIPTGVDTFRIYYIPKFTRLVADADTFDAINGYEALVLEIAFYKCKDREELDTSQIEREIARLSANVRTSSDGRDAEPFYLDPLGPEADDDEEYL